MTRVTDEVRPESMTKLDPSPDVHWEYGDTAANKSALSSVHYCPNLDRVSNYWAVYPTNVFEKDYGA